MPMQLHTVTVPRALVDHLADTTDDAVREALSAGHQSRGAVRVTTDVGTLWAILDLCGPLWGDGADASKSERDAMRRYDKALRALPEGEPRMVTRSSVAPVVTEPTTAAGCPVPVVSSGTGEPTGATCGGDVSGPTCARCGAFSPAAEAAADRVQEARTLASEAGSLADRAEGLSGDAARWGAEADRARTVDRVAECAESARESAETLGRVAVRGEVKASGLVKDAASKLRRILAIRKEVEAETAHVGDDAAEGRWDTRHAAVVTAETDAREALGRVEDASRSAWEWVDSAEDIEPCRMCGCLPLVKGERPSGQDGAQYATCGCRAMIAALFADLGSVCQNAADVAVGRMLWADDTDTVSAGQLALVDVNALDAATGADAAEDVDAADAAAEWDASVVAERTERAERRAAADAAQTTWDWVWGVTGGERIPGSLVRVVRPDGRPVDVQWAGWGMPCWTHCADECPGQVDPAHCTCERRPVVALDGPAEPYAWEDCAECAAGTLGVDVDVMRDAAWASKVGGAGQVGAERPAGAVTVVTEPETLAADLDAESARWADASRTSHSLAEAEADSRTRSDDVLAHFRAESEEWGARSIACAEWAAYWRAVGRGDVRPVVAAPVVAADPEPEPTGGEGAQGDGDSELPSPAESDDRAGVVRRGPYGRPVIPRSVALAHAVANAERAEGRAAVLKSMADDASRVADAAGAEDVTAGVLADRAWARWGQADRLAWRVRYDADRMAKDHRDTQEAVEYARRSASRVLAGDIPAHRGAWLSADGGAAITFPLSWDWEDNPTGAADCAYVALLADVVAARDAGRVLTTADLPTKPKHGRSVDTSGMGDRTFRQAVAGSKGPLWSAWKAPKVPAAGRALDGKALDVMDAAECAAETEAAPGVWLPMAAVLAAETAVGNGWTVAMERHDGGRTVIVRASGTVARGERTAAGEAVGVWTDGLFVQARSGALVGARWIQGGTLSQVLSTVGTACVEPGVIVSAGRADAWSAPAPAGVSDPGGVEGWEGDGGSVVGVQAVTAVPEPVKPVRDRAAEPGDSLVPWAGPEFGDYRVPGTHAVTVTEREAPGYGFDGACSAPGCGMTLWYPGKSDARQAGDNHVTDAARFAADPIGWDRRGFLLTDGRAERRAGESVFAADAEGGAPSLFVGIGGAPWEGGRTYRVAVTVDGERTGVVISRYTTAREEVGAWTLAAGEGMARVLDGIRAWDAVRSARALDVVSDPGGADGWETDGPAGRHAHGELPRPAERDDVQADADDDRSDLETMWDEWRDVGAGSAEWWARQPYADQLAAVGGHPELVRWLVTPWREGDPVRMVEVCHGPGGMATGRGIVGADGVDAIGFEIDPDTAATARAAGHTVVCADIRTIDPRWACFRDVKRVHLSTPCPTLSPGGKRAGLKPDQIAGMVSLMFDASRLLGGMRVDDVCGFYGGPHDIWGEVNEDHECDTDERDCVCVVGHEHCWEGELPPVMTPAEYRAAGLEIDADPHGRTSLMLEVILWPLVLQAMGAPIETVTMEQSANLLKAAPGLCEAMQGELRVLGWDWVSFQIEDAADHGAASHRERTWMIARQTGKPEGAAYDMARPRYGSWGPDTFDYVDLYQGNEPLPVVTMAEALGVPSDWLLDSRGARGINPKTGKPKGGGTHRMDVPGICVTAPAYGWRLRPADQPQGSGTRAVTLVELARLVGFGDDYPWQYTPARKGAEGVRNKTQQVADVVSPFSGALVEAAVGSPRANWYRKLRAYQVALYRLAAYTAEWEAEPERPALPAAPVRLALTAGPVPTGRKFWEPGERVTLDGRAGRTRQSHIGRGVRVLWDDASELDATWETPERLWAEGTEPARRRPVAVPYVAPVRVIAPPYVAPVVPPVVPVVVDPAPVVIPSPRRSTVGAGDSLDLFAALDAELSALSGAWDRAAI
ncbi:hypothetical protein ACFT0G_06100 [Streptomyces sp. NPDC057020]|uniref:hypothetical protein n=1 Tax=unclassified Streptomyces TaxID=2593676 RepID=UPI0036274036